jgi:hypothetical protein
MGRAGAAHHRKSWTTAANDGQSTVLVSSRFGAFAQVTQPPGLSLARRKPGPILSRLQAFGLWDLALGRALSIGAGLVPWSAAACAPQAGAITARSSRSFVALAGCECPAGSPREGHEAGRSAVRFASTEAVAAGLRDLSPFAPRRLPPAASQLRSPLARVRRCNTGRPANAVSDTYPHYDKAVQPTKVKNQRSAIASASPQGHGAPGGGHRRRRPQRRSRDRWGPAPAVVPLRGKDRRSWVCCLSPARLVGSGALGPRSEDRWFPARGSWCQGRGTRR